MRLPRLYAIADPSVLTARRMGLREFAEGLRGAGVGLVQLRDKRGIRDEVLARAAVLREVFAGPDSGPDSGPGRQLGDDEMVAKEGHGRAILIMNDWANLAVEAGFDGVHVGQGDVGVKEARRVLGGTGWVGVSTHTDDEVCAGELSGADYIAIGPVFATGTKADAAPVVGLEGVRRARALTRKPLVAIGGITRENCRSVVQAGADSVAVIGGLLIAGEGVEAVARDFLRILR